jgi:GR25 family glycosyltransferase involved in LPS biosynthesis
MSKAFIISLKDSPRRQHVETHIHNWTLPFPVEISEAIPKKKINIIESTVKLETGEIFTVDNSRMLYIEKRLLTPGDIACVLSHYLTWKKVVNDDTITHALILEDDFIFTLPYSNIAHIISALPSDFDICYYQAYSSYFMVNKISDLYYNTFPSTGAYGYIISRRFAKKLVDTFKLNRQTDEYIAEYIMNIEPNTKILSCFYPFVGYSSNFTSEVGYIV